jgi:hypothetical protein
MSQEKIIGDLRKKLAGVQEALVFAVVLPAIQGLGVSGGFQMRKGRPCIAGLSQITMASGRAVCRTAQLRERGCPMGMRRLRVLAASFLAIMFLSATACGCLGGGSSKTQVQSTTTTTTLGQELQDLQKAHESGAIDDKQYEKARKELLKKYNAD